MKALREKKGLTQKQTAELCGVSKRTYCNYEYGTFPIPSNVLRTLARVFDCTADMLLGLSDITAITIIDANDEVIATIDHRDVCCKQGFKAVFHRD